MIAAPRWLTRQVVVWSLYDVATSVYLPVVTPILFPLLFRSHLAEGDRLADLWFGIAAAGSQVIGGLGAPLAGALADRRQFRLPAIASITVVWCGATAVIGWLETGAWIAGLVTFVIAQASGAIGQSLYDSYLPEVAVRGCEDRVSTFGWAVGFLGGILAIVILLAGRDPGESTDVSALRWSFEVVAVIFAALAVPALFGLRSIERERRPVAAHDASSFADAYRTVVGTIRHWRAHRAIFHLLAGIYLISNATVAIMFFVGVYFATTYGISVTGLLWLALLYHVIAVPATLASGALAARTSLKTALWVALTFVAAAIVLLAAGSGLAVAVVVMCVIAVSFGALQALCRALLVTMVARDKAAEFFGFNAVAGRLSGAGGPVVFGLLSAATGSPRFAVTSLLLFLAAGAWMLRTVPMTTARESRAPATAEFPSI